MVYEKELTVHSNEQIWRMREDGYSVSDTARMLQLTAEQVRHAIRCQPHGNQELDETEVIDGELIGARIQRLTQDIKEGRLVIKQGRRKANVN